MIACPLCGAQLDIVADEVEEGDILSCFDCDTDLVVISIGPVQLSPALEEGEEDPENKLDDLEEDDAEVDDLD